MRQPKLIRQLFLFALAGSFWLINGRTAPAAGQIGRPHVATSIDDADADYAFQGEYYGTLGYVGGGPWQPFGLQVAAQGNGDYIAVEYPGGLPGLGWYGGASEKIYLRGRREPDRLTLRGEGKRYDIVDGTAWFVDQNGDKLTWLTKVNRQSRSLGAPPPPNAVVLFDGLKTDQLVNARVSPNGLLREGAATKDAWQDYFLHVEFQLSYMPFARQQGRSNSGIYLQRSYEIQILDSFALEGFPNECGAIYRYRAPEINMCLPPLAWQTYDIDFRSARFDVSGKKTEDAYVTVWHNGYAVQEQVPIARKTGHGKPESPELLPIEFQNHGDPVRFRNIWLVVNSRQAGQYDSHLPFNTYQQPGSSVYGNVHLPQRHGFYWTGRLTPSATVVPVDALSTNAPLPSGQSSPVPEPPAGSPPPAPVSP
jgi:Domain of Unknown Function (DUF1080)